MNICKISRCKSNIYAKGLCSKHYTRVWRYGDPNKTMKTATGEPMEFFNSQLDSHSEDCYIWRYKTIKSGYGVIGCKGKEILVHRLSLAMRTNKYGHSACHTCGNKLCFNPNHLYWGDATTNAIDSSEAGVYDKRRKLSPAAVRHIRSMEMPAKDLAKLYNISLSAVYKVRNGTSYRIDSIIRKLNKDTY